MRYALLFAIAISCTTFGFVAPVHADALDAGISVPVGSGLAPAPIAVVVLPPAAALPDPLEHPFDAISDAQLLSKVGWPALVGAILVMLTKALAYMSTATKLRGFPVVGAVARWLAVGRNAVAVAAIGTLAAVGYNVIVQGGTWAAAAIAMLISGAGLMHSTTQPKAAA